MNGLRTVGTILLIAALAAVAGVQYYNSRQRQTPVIFSDTELLSNTWANYKKTNLEEGTLRTLDKDRSFITTSEGQSYTMLRAVWMDDKATFDTSYQWTKDNLNRPNDKLFSWLFGKRSDGTYGVISERGGNNAASDSDVDIALALLMAHGRWGNEVYKGDALALIQNIWKYEVVEVQGKPVLAANDIERNATDSIIVNPSYFSPYAFRIFAQVNSENNWSGLAKNSYDLLNQLSQAKLGSTTSVGLPPNWVLINRTTGEVTAPTAKDLTTDYGYDAMRVPWRIALDYTWNKAPEAKEYLDKMSFFTDQWKASRTLATVYGHNGTVITAQESPAMYGTTLGYFIVSDPKNARDYVKEKLQKLYNTDTNAWYKPMSYYDDNWAWFGLALASNQLPNLVRL